MSAATELRLRARRIREHVLHIAAGSQGTHVGGALSCADVLAVLYFGVMRVDPQHPDWRERDHLIFSKGHASAALYAALAERGFLPVEELRTYAQAGGRLAGHPLWGVPGVELATGSLGHGLSFATGLALAARLDGRPNRVFVLLGDGELQEGSNWEAIMAAAHHGLDNLTAIVDRNGWQITGPTEECVRLEPLADRWRSFGWAAQEVDGHDVTALEKALTQAPMATRAPTVVIARTVKGKGVPFLEGRKGSHYARLKPELRDRALAGLAAGSRRTET